MRSGGEVRGECKGERAGERKRDEREKREGWTWTYEEEIG